MATIDLGKLGFVNKGTYSSSTSYEKNDLVQYTDSGILSTYLYINAAAATGQTPSTSGTVNGTYWAYYAKGGAAGADGTNVATTITTQGDILYRDGSGLARLAAGTSGYFLKTQGSGANPTWAEVTTSVLKVETFQTTSRQSVSGGSYTTVMSGNYTKLSASSKIVVFLTYGQFGEANGSGTVQFNLGTSSDLGSTSYGNTSNHSKQVSNQFYISNNTQTGSLAWTFKIKDFGGTIFCPSSSDDSRIDSGAGQGTLTIMEYA